MSMQIKNSTFEFNHTGIMLNNIIFMLIIIQCINQI